MAASDAKLFPTKNTAFRVTFPIYDNTGALVSGAAGLDSEVSIDGGTFTDCTNEATEIATSSGIYYLDLTAGEMNGDTIAILVKTSTTDAKTTVLIFYPVVTTAVQLGVNVVSMAANSVTSSALATSAIDEIADAVWDEVLTGATHNIANSAGRRLRENSVRNVHTGTCQSGSTANTVVLDTGASSSNGTYDPAMIFIDSGTGAGQTRFIIDYVGSTRTATIARDWRIVPDNTSTFVIISSVNLFSTNEGRAQAGGASTITLNASASSIDNSYVGQTIVLRTGTGQDQSRVVSSYNGTTKVATLSQPWTTVPDTTTGYMMWPVGRAMIAEMLDNVITSGALSAGAVTAIQNGLATASALTTVDTVVDAIQAKTDNLPASPAATGDIPTATENADALLKRDMSAVTGEATRSPLNALRFVRNGFSITGTTLTVLKEDDLTAAYTRDLTVDPTAQPITGVS